MKDFKKPPFKQKAVAIGFTLGVHRLKLLNKLKLYLLNLRISPRLNLFL